MCHAKQSAQAEFSRMSRTLAPARELGTARIEGTVEGYRYSVTSDVLEVRHGENAVRAAVRWIFGSGRTGQTFIVDLDGESRESRVSYYPAVQGLDLTIGAANAAPSSLRDALGRSMSKSDVRECFGCHASALSGSGPGEPPKLIEGVRCERCHGDASKHLAKPVRGSVASLKSASTEDISELCGACHRTWEQVMLMKLKGVNTVRFQPFRLSQSRCYNPADRRISCTACHDPHAANTLSVARVDAVCSGCHASPVHRTVRAGKDCAGCHMPAYELPGAHTTFRDHRIHVAQPGEPFPD